MSTDFTPVKSAIRTLEIIDMLTETADGLSFVDLQQKLGWPRSSTYNLLRTMAEAGHLEFDELDRKYRIGIRLWEAGQAFVRTRELARVAQRHLEAACSALNETVQLAVLDGLDNVYIAKVESDHHLQLVSNIGSRLPAYATGLGKALLAGLSPAELEHRLSTAELHAFTQRTITSKDALLRKVEEVRTNGFATDEGEFTVGVYCVAVPVRDASGNVIAAMSSSVPQVRVTEQLQAAMREVLTNQAMRLSVDLGYGNRRKLPDG